MLRSTLPVVVAAWVASCMFLVAGPVHAGVNPSDRAPELVRAKDDRGRSVKLKSYRDRIVVITFGASWCKPCKKELPAWDALAADYKPKGVVFLAINIDKDLNKGKAFVKAAKLKAMQVVYNPDGATVESYDPPTMPTTYIIGPRGIVRHVHSGYRNGDAKELAATIDKLL